ncbi:uncharacterized protein K444DRAFT_648288 [Hyaloscypha bicolor E]|uniref:Uncharacterized protein n=1 Tax=Hyaloscypha bicolor E TaxID=1095630 RepID=A0A2J6SHV0_9HELO|nr:uncharacterized protein K444DRAFT_648288 [Hyaloscypha bicolor E]PMD50348.1 hypothetical protein K444DRAFT_648288 [Hyaloscypha bicolor E]
MVLFQILRFALPQSSAISAPAFLKLREFVRSHGQAEDQYFDHILSDPQLRKQSDEMCWVIQWPNGSDLRTNASFRSKLNEATQDNYTKSLLFEYNESQTAELKKGLEAPVTEFAIINLSPTAPLQDAGLQRSMHKTYTDCYFAGGFSGGNWAYSLNTNDVDELLRENTGEKAIPAEGRRLAVYPLGWESKEHHTAYSCSPLFDEEILKLAPWFGPGTGAWWVTLEKHRNNQLPIANPSSIELLGG